MKKALCVSREDLNAALKSVGQVLPERGLLQTAIGFANGLQNIATSINRTDELEKNREIKQLIPYISCYLVGQPDLMLHYNRKGDETRLHGLSSIGIGGHIEGLDFYKGMFREMKEELGFALESTNDMFLQFAGLLNDDTTEVGSVHLGVVFHFGIDTVRLGKINFGNELLNPRFQVPNKDLAGYESWSQILLETWARGSN